VFAPDAHFPNADQKMELDQYEAFLDYSKDFAGRTHHESVDLLYARPGQYVARFI